MASAFGSRLGKDITEEDLEGIAYREIPKPTKRYRRVVFDAMATCLEMNHNPIEWAIHCARDETVEMCTRERANAAVLARVSPILKSIEQSFDAEGKYALNIIFKGLQNDNESNKP